MTFTAAAQWIARQAGQAGTFAAAVGLVLLWGLCGPVFDFSETWQLLINTGTTVVTFLMMFLLQHTQNRDTAEMKAQLAELIIASDKAHNAMASLEGLTDPQLAGVAKRNVELAQSEGLTP